MDILDQYMLRQTVAMSADVTRWYDEFAFHKIYHRINDFCVVELSAFYFDVLKDRLYTSAPNSRGRRAAQTAIWRIGEALVRLLAPIMSFTCDEVWQYLPDGAGSPGQRASGATSPAHLTFWVVSAAAEDPKQTRRLDDSAGGAQRSAEGAGRSPQQQADRRANLEAQVTVTAAEPVLLRAGALPGPAALSVHRVGGHAAARPLRQRDRRGQRPGQQGRRQEVRTLLELFDPRGRGSPTIPPCANAAARC